MKHLIVGIAALFLAGCASYRPHVQGVAGTSPAAAVPWTPPPAESRALKLPEDAVPAAELSARWRRLSLAEAVDIALQNNPDTRMAWANARAAAAGFGAARSSWLPSLKLDGDLGRGRQESDPARASDYPATTTYSGAAGLSWLLFDFGGRAAAIDASRQALLAADWTHNAVLQNVVLQTEAAYYGCAGARAMLDASQASLASAEIALKAAEEKRSVGLATSADVLQARTAWSQALLDVQNAEGDLRISRGSLALAMGYPAYSAGDLAATIPEVPADTLVQQVDQLVTKALADRPDLQAVRARARAAQANVRQARASLLPTISAAASAERLWYYDADQQTTVYNGGLQIAMPLFGGFSRQYQLARAKAEADAAGEQVRGAEQDASFQVYSSHSDFLTARARVATTDDLLASAQQSEQVALGRYKEGVGTILDLLTAQRALTLARAQQINARLSWHIALAQLAHDIGILGVSGENPLIPGSTQSR
ncbi:MAG TPA: TolC family protein [bacterium]|nr:TolC family protein [bacterium]HPR89336.1 TolC family protein [bacterium]